MRSFLRNLVVKVRMFLTRGSRPDDNPVRDTAWELIPFSFEVDWLVDNEHRVEQFPHTAACYCYYCRIRYLWENEDSNPSRPEGRL